MSASEEESVFSPPKAETAAHVIGAQLDALSAPELEARIEDLRREIARLEAAIRARAATKEAAHAFFKR